MVPDQCEHAEPPADARSVRAGRSDRQAAVLAGRGPERVDHRAARVGVILNPDRRPDADGGAALQPGQGTLHQRRPGRRGLAQRLCVSL